MNRATQEEAPVGAASVRNAPLGAGRARAPGNDVTPGEEAGGMTNGFEFLVVFTTGALIGMGGAAAVMSCALRQSRQPRRPALTEAPVVDLEQHRLQRQAAH